MPIRGTRVLLLMLAACAHAPSRPDTAHPTATGSEVATRDIPEKRAEASPVEPVVDFARDVRPILEARCQPCHFPGGKMYDALPFDRAATIRGLGTKLFTRIKAPEEKAVIERFLAQP